MQPWGEVNKPCQMHPSYEQGGNVTETSTVVGKCLEDGVFIGTLCSTWFGPSLSFFQLSFGIQARCQRCMALARVSPAFQQSWGPCTAPARDNSAKKPDLLLPPAASSAWMPHLYYRKIRKVDRPKMCVSHQTFENG